MEYLRPTYAEINLANLLHNLSIIKSKISSGVKIMGVIKANAYGHGASAVARKLALNGVECFGVSSLEEGMILRNSGIIEKILILGSQFPFDSFRELIKYSFTPTIASFESAKELDKYSGGLNLKVGYHYKIDTGMGRIGVAVQNALVTFKKIRELGNIFLEGIYTHLARADSDRAYTKKQLRDFKESAYKIKSCSESGVILHAANSSAALGFKDSHFDMVRTGLALYGLKPYKGDKLFNGFKPVMSLKSRIVYLKNLPKNAPVSYGGSFKTKRSSRIATIPIGYADGYNRLLSNKGKVIIKNSFCPVVGRVTMDMIMVDVTGLGDVHVGDECMLIGRSDDKSITAEDIAKQIGSISYEVVCQISNRVPRKYID